MIHQLNDLQRKWIRENTTDFSDLNAVFLNCTLKKSPEISNTEGLMDLPKQIMEACGVSCELIRIVDHNLAFGVQPDMAEHGWEVDEWPDIQKKVMDAEILIIGTPIWIGKISSVAALVLERLSSYSAKQNEKGQYAYYGRTAGCVVTGNEDGIKNCARDILYSLQHFGYIITPQADTGWVGDVGPGPSYLDEDSGGPEKKFTNRNATFMSWNLMHLARLLKDNNGIPAHGNQIAQWP